MGARRRTQSCPVGTTFQPKPWNKTLYENLGYPDNYTDNTFLQELRKNVYFREVHLLTTCLQAGAVTQQVCVVICFFVVFHFLQNDVWDPTNTLVMGTLLVLVGYVLYRTLIDLQAKVLLAIYSDVKLAIILVSFGYVLSPVLKTLTDTISTDTIYAMSSVMMVVHLLFFNYGVSAAIISGTLSLTTAIFGSLCLASRLQTPFHAFVLLAVAIEAFVLFPIFCSKVEENALLLITCVVVTTVALAHVASTAVLVLFIIIVFLFNILFPYLFYKWQKYKDNIYGPWDEAMINDIIDVGPPLAE